MGGLVPLEVAGTVRGDGKTNDLSADVGHAGESVEIAYCSSLPAKEGRACGEGPGYLGCTKFLFGLVEEFGDGCKKNVVEAVVAVVCVVDVAWAVVLGTPVVVSVELGGVDLGKVLAGAVVDVPEIWKGTVR